MIETRVEGSPASVREAASWLRSVADGIDSAADRVTRARHLANRGWSGAAADGYLVVSSPLIKATDEHATRAARAARALREYADVMQTTQETMRAIRSRAISGGLPVAGSVVHPPAAALDGAFLPGSPEDLARRDASIKAALYQELSDEASKAWATLVEWTDFGLRNAVAEACEADDVTRMLRTIEPYVPSGVATGLAFGVSRVAFSHTAGRFAHVRAEHRRLTRVSGSRALRARDGTPSDTKYLDDLFSGKKTLRLAAKTMGPVGLVVDIGFGIKEGHETGDWKRAAITTGTGIAIGMAAPLVLAATVGSAPATLVVVASVGCAVGGSWAVGRIYDNWDDITGWAGEQAEVVKNVLLSDWHSPRALGARSGPALVGAMAW